jgi:glycosyltransferase involved in cell wall biosynthesis
VAANPPLRILVVHNLYRTAGGPSGENQVVRDEVALLRDAGVEVETYFRSSDEIASFGLGAKAGMLVRPIYSRSDVTAVGAVLDAYRPDVVHLHNPFPLISPAIIHAAKDRGVALVQSVHNHRHVCVQGAFLRDGRPCQDCSDRRVPWPAVAHGCYRGSRAQSVVMATALTVHKPTWRLVDRFLPVSTFTAEHLIRAGVAADKVIVKPNSVADPGPVKPLGEGLLMVARLAPGKGLDFALDAWKRSGLGFKTRFVVAGDGPDRPLVDAAMRSLPGLEYAGLVDQQRVGELFDECAVSIVPSLWSEPFGRVAIEAFAHGRAVIATDVGGLAGIVTDDCGWRVKPTVEALSDAMVAALNGGEAERKGLAARDRFESLYTNDRVVKLLLEIYRSVSRS